MDLYTIQHKLITGTDESPQIIEYDTLTDFSTGELLDEVFDDRPIISIPQQYRVHLTERPHSSYFKIALDLLRPVGDIYINFFVIVPGVTTSIFSNLSLDNMLDLLAVYLNDKEEIMFPPLLKVEMLNMAQDKTVRLLNRNQLTKIQFSQKTISISSTDGSLDLTTLDETLFNGIEGIEYILSDDDYPLHYLTERQWEKYKRDNVTFDTQDPVFTNRGNYIYVEPYSSISTIGIYGIREPVKMILSNNGAGNTDCEFGYNIQIIIVGMACEEFIDKFPFAKMAYNKAFNLLNELNGTKLPSSIVKGISLGSIGIGVKRHGSAYKDI